MGNNLSESLKNAIVKAKMENTLSVTAGMYGFQGLFARFSIDGSEVFVIPHPFLEPESDKVHAVLQAEAFKLKGEISDLFDAEIADMFESDTVRLFSFMNR